MALVLAPEPPVAEWMAALDAQIQRSPSFFDGRPVLGHLEGAERAGDAMAVLRRLVLGIVEDEVLAEVPARLELADELAAEHEVPGESAATALTWLTQMPGLTCTAPGVPAATKVPGVKL